MTLDRILTWKELLGRAHHLAKQRVCCLPKEDLKQLKQSFADLFHTEEVGRLSDTTRVQQAVGAILPRLRERAKQVEPKLFGTGTLQIYIPRGGLPMQVQGAFALLSAKRLHVYGSDQVDVYSLSRAPVVQQVKRLWIHDGCCASAASLSYVIDQAKEAYRIIDESNIWISLLVAAPEAIVALVNQHPNIRIICGQVLWDSWVDPLTLYIQGRAIGDMGDRLTGTGGPNEDMLYPGMPGKRYQLVIRDDPAAPNKKNFLVGIRYERPIEFGKK